MPKFEQTATFEEDWDTWRGKPEKNMTDDVMEVDLYPDGSAHFSIDEPWAGDSETGFGRQTNISLSPDAVKKLIAFLSGPLTQGEV